MQLRERKGETSNSCVPGLDICQDFLVYCSLLITRDMFPNPQVLRRKQISSTMQKMLEIVLQFYLVTVLFIKKLSAA